MHTHTHACTHTGCVDVCLVFLFFFTCLPPSVQTPWFSTGNKSFIGEGELPHQVSQNLSGLQCIWCQIPVSTTWEEASASSLYSNCLLPQFNLPIYTQKTVVCGFKLIESKKKKKLRKRIIHANQIWAALVVWTETRTPSSTGGNKLSICALKCSFMHTGMKLQIHFLPETHSSGSTTFRLIIYCIWAEWDLVLLSCSHSPAATLDMLVSGPDLCPHGNSF